MTTARKVVGRPFQKGDDPRRNTHGPRALPVTRALAMKMTDVDAEKIAAMAIERALAGDPWFVQFVTERLEGKAIARNENAGPGDFADLADVDTEQLRKALKVVK